MNSGSSVLVSTARKRTTLAFSRPATWVAHQRLCSEFSEPSRATRIFFNMGSSILINWNGASGIPRPPQGGPDGLPPGTAGSPRSMRNLPQRGTGGFAAATPGNSPVSHGSFPENDVALFLLQEKGAL